MFDHKELDKALRDHPGPKTMVKEFREYFGEDAELAAIMGFTWYSVPHTTRDQESGLW